MVAICLVLSYVLWLLSRVSVEGLDCYSCTNVTSLTNCDTVTMCPTGSACYNEVSSVGGVRRYTLGCKSATTCAVGPSATPSTEDSIDRSATWTCSECCGFGMCNRRLCQNEYHACKDTTDCSIIGAFSNICDDADHIKNVCRRFCGLCNLVDGSWSDWSVWSNCNVTCGDGVVTRTRMCNNPAPENGGKACVGSQQETQKCTSCAICSVAGGWNQWSSWGSCSASCDIGLQVRDRSCSNPAPSGGGVYCNGTTSDNRLCFPGACADGQWSHWGSWGSCTETCGGGLRTRSRACDNPTPSLTGRYCVGDQKESVICNKQLCTRTITFTAKQLAQTYLYSRQHLVYTHSIQNVGGGYDNCTGYFTAPVAGTYQFNVRACSRSNRWIGVCIMAQGQSVGSAAYYEKDETDGICASGSGIAVLEKGDRVWIQSMYDARASNDPNNMNSFSGVLIGP